MAKGTFPNFIIVGAQKSATRWLRTNLGQHPQIFTADRELEFFNHNWNEGASWYHARFEGWGGEPAVGEATPGYMMWNEEPHIQAARIDGLLPAVRLVALLRNPLERSLSALIHFQREGRIPPDRTLVEHTRVVAPREDPVCVVAGSWYADCLRPYARRFGQRLLVLLHDDIKEAPEGIFSSVSRHLDVDPTFVPPKVSKVRFSNPAPGGSAYASEQGHRKGLSDEEREQLFPLFASQIDELEEMFGLDLDRWRL